MSIPTADVLSLVIAAGVIGNVFFILSIIFVQRWANRTTMFVSSFGVFLASVIACTFPGDTVGLESSGCSVRQHHGRFLHRSSIADSVLGLRLSHYECQMPSTKPQVLDSIECNSYSVPIGNQDSSQSLCTDSCLESGGTGPFAVHIRVGVWMGSGQVSNWFLETEGH